MSRHYRHEYTLRRNSTNKVVTLGGLVGRARRKRLLTSLLGYDPAMLKDTVRALGLD